MQTTREEEEEKDRKGLTSRHDTPLGFSFGGEFSTGMQEEGQAHDKVQHWFKSDEQCS